MPLTQEQIQNKFNALADVDNPTWSQLKAPLIALAKTRIAARLDITENEVTNSMIKQGDFFAGMAGVKTIKIAQIMIMALRKIHILELARTKLGNINLQTATVQDLGDNLWRVVKDA